MRRFTILSTPLGPFTLIADQQGLCGLSFPNEGPPPDAAPVVMDEHPLLAEASRQLSAYLAGQLQDFALPLSLAGTPFRMAVWEQLRRIPYGKTMSYGELAERVGGREKARAVGGAAHANPLGIIIPCHRLIGAGGSLTGFGGGLTMKETLLDLERTHAAQKKARNLEKKPIQ